MSSITVASTSDSNSLALVSPSRTTLTDSSCIVPTDTDVLCGRGKGIRKHPGNEFFNRLLRENYDEYKAAPKGSKVSIVKKIVSLVQEKRGRFLECKTKHWVDIGHERAVNKTAQAFRDIRPTMEKDRPSINYKKPISSEKDSSNSPRRPTFRERLAMLEREQQQRNSQTNNTSSDESTTVEEEISDTETEESFPVND